MQRGYDPFEEQDWTRACETWLPLWDRFKEVIRAWGIRGVVSTTKGPDTVYAGEQFFCNWCQDLEEALGNAAAKDPTWWPRAMQYAREFRLLLPESETLALVNLAILEARGLDATGRLAERDTLLERLPRLYPHSGWAWITWGDRWFDGGGWGWSGSRDVRKAKTIYELGLAGEVDEPEVLRERLQSLAERSSARGTRSHRRSEEGRPA